MINFEISLLSFISFISDLEICFLHVRCSLLYLLLARTVRKGKWRLIMPECFMSKTSFHNNSRSVCRPRSLGLPKEEPGVWSSL